MWGFSWGELAWGESPSNQVTHGHAIAAGIRAIMAQEIQRRLAQESEQRSQLSALLQQTVAVRRWQLVEQMERAITIRDEDDLFLVLSV